MKIVIVWAFLALLPLTANAKNKGVKKVPIEKGAQINEEMRGNSQLLQTLTRAVKQAGYRCDAISAARPFELVRGYTLSCNKSKYTYSIRDLGGSLTVSID